MRSETINLLAGHTLTITADAISYGYYHRLADSAGGEPYSLIALGVSSSVVLGPFATNRVYSVDTSAGQLTYATAIPEIENDGDIDDFSGLATSFKTIPATRSVTVSSGEQLAIFGTFTVLGTITIAGEMRVGAWPF